MPRSLVAPPQPAIELAPGVVRKRIHPGGRRGPHDEVLGELMGGQVWTDTFLLGGASDDFVMCVPDIRLPANQYWPLHYHDCWIAVIILEGSCLIGDWHMQVGDVLISEDKLEYGPLVIGPSGCQMFEIFARLIPDEGGYAEEYRDHPTLQGSSRNFHPRSERNKRNEGRMTLPVDGVEGLTKGHLTPGACWDLGPAGDPQRGVMGFTQLAAGEHVPAHRYDDWHGIFVLEGAMTLEGEPLPKHDVLLIEPGRTIGELVAGPHGAQLLEVARTAAGFDRR